MQGGVGGIWLPTSECGLGMEAARRGACSWELPTQVGWLGEGTEPSTAGKCVGLHSSCLQWDAGPATEEATSKN